MCIRDRVKEIQDKIVGLVGDQAKNLDLVNGKLDDQLFKLRDITLESAKQAQSDLERAKITAKAQYDLGINAQGSPLTQIGFNYTALQKALGEAMGCLLYTSRCV